MYSFSKPVADVRARLNRFTDIEFDTFCQDHFSEIYITFSDGMLLSAKIKVLIDYYIRSEEHCKRLITLLFQETAGLSGAERIPRAHELIEVHYFDLIEWTKLCIDAYWEGSGPLFIVLHTSHEKIFNCLRLRLISEFGEDMFHDDLPEPFKLSPNIIDLELKGLIQRKHMLAESAILRAYTFEDQAILDQLYQSITQHFVEGMNHRLIILLGLDETFQPPADISLRLQQPIFSKGDIWRWLKHVSLLRRLERGLVDYWYELMQIEFYPRGEFNITWAYRHLEFAMRELGAPNFDVHTFRRKLEERRKLYA